MNYFDDTFAYLDEYYPGSKRKRRPAPVPVKPVTGWEDDFFEKYLPNGNLVKMYTIGSLAKAIGRPTKTLRFWIESGNIPTSPYRLPATTSAKGKEYAGRRLYSQAMVEVTIDLFHKYGLLGKNRVEWSNYRNLTNEIAEAWDKIRADEMKTN